MFLPLAFLLCVPSASALVDPASRLVSFVAPPPAYDLRGSGRLFPPKHQGSCNSCYAMAATTSMEYWAGVELPVQNIMDCSRSGQSPCKSGGAAIDVFVWAQRENVYLIDKKYEERDGMCNREKTKTYFKLNGVDEERFIDSDRLKYLVWTYGPVVASIQMPANGFVENQKVTRAVCINAKRKSNTISHSISIVGYDASDNFLAQDSSTGKYYWIEMLSCELGSHVLYVTAGQLTSE